MPCPSSTTHSATCSRMWRSPFSRSPEIRLHWHKPASARPLSHNPAPPPAAGRRASRIGASVQALPQYCFLPFAILLFVYPPQYFGLTAHIPSSKMDRFAIFSRSGFSASVAFTQFHPPLSFSLNAQLLFAISKKPALS